MEKLFLLFFICLLSVQSSIAQKQNNIQTVNIEIRTLRTQQDSLLQHIEDLEYQISRQEDVQTLLAERLINTRDDYENILADSHSTRNITLVWVTIIVGALGVFYPIMHNRNANKEQKAIIRQINDALIQINSVKEKVNNIQSKIEKSEKKAEVARKQSYVSSLFSRAVNEKNTGKALRLYTNIIRIDDRYADAYFNRAIVYFDIDNYPEAKCDIANYIHLCDKDYKGYVVQGLINAKLNRYKDAMADFSTAISYAPNESDIYKKRASVYIDFTQWRYAIKDYDKIEEMMALEDIHYNNRAYSYLKLGKLDLALADVNDAIKLNDKLPEAYDTRGSIYVKMGRDYYHLAIDDFTKAILLNPKLWDTYENRANLYKTMAGLETDPEKKKEYTSLWGNDLYTFRHKRIRIKDKDSDIDKSDK